MSAQLGATTAATTSDDPVGCALFCLAAYLRLVLAFHSYLKLLSVTYTTGSCTGHLQYQRR